MADHIYQGKRLGSFLQRQKTIQFRGGKSGRRLIGTKTDKLTG